MEIKNYKHIITEVVKFHEIDILGICNNAVYFNYFEDARIKYMQNLKKIYKFIEILEGNSFFIMVRNECDYIKSSFLDDNLSIFTRIEFIKNSSFGFRHLVVNNANDIIIAKGSGVVVHYDKSTHKSLPLPNEFYDAVLEYENDVEILKTDYIKNFKVIV